MPEVIERSADAVRKSKWREENRAQDKAYKKAYKKTESGKAERARYRRKKSDLLRGFIAVDGEGWKDEKGEDFLWLLGASSGQQIRCERGQRLSTEQCLEFLFSLQSKGKALVGFGLNYDIQHILHDLTDEQFTASREEECFVNFGKFRYAIKRVPKKFLQIRRWPRTQWTEKQPKGSRIILFDSFTFFGTTFVKALENWGLGTPEELSFLQKMKDLRGDFRSVPEEEIVRYNDLECALFVALMTELDKAAQESLGVRLTWWHGPGSLAKAVMKKHGIREQVEVDRQLEKPRELLLVQYRAYFGGRFQVFSLGTHRKVYEYDICSAYPDQIRLLPHLGGRWRKTDRYEPGCVAIYDVVWNVGESRGDNVHWPLTPFPWRDDKGSIHYPPSGRGSYYHHEIAAAIDAWGSRRICVVGGWIYEPPREGSPFSPWVEELYAERLRIGKGSKGLAIKLALNSAYGVTAQKKISFKHTPVFRCPLWAGLITSGTRAKLLSAALQKPADIISFATDGVYATEALALTISKELGDWEEGEYAELGIWQPGIYFKQKEAGGKRESRGRGIPERLLNFSELEEVWAKEGVRGTVCVTIPESFVSRDLAISWGRSEAAYHWQPLKKELTLHPGTGTHDWLEGSNRWNTYLSTVDYKQQSAPYPGMDFEVVEESEWSEQIRQSEMEFNEVIEL